MRSSLVILLILLLASCKQNQSSDTTTDQMEESQIMEVEESLNMTQEEQAEQRMQALKREQLLIEADDREELGEMLMAKNFFKETDDFILDFRYPELNELIDPAYANFNNHILHDYIDVMGTEAQILEDKAMFCDTIAADRLKEERKIDYKVYTTSDELLSVMFYKENYYVGAMHSTYMFDCFNYDLKENRFMEFEDFFRPDTEKDIVAILNRRLKEGSETGDCWEITMTDFDLYKNNFVMGDKMIEFYFDDCVICPSYTGTFSIEVPLDLLLEFMKQYNNDPAIGQ